MPITPKSISSNVVEQVPNESKRGKSNAGAKRMSNPLTNDPMIDPRRSPVLFTNITTIFTSSYTIKRNLRKDMISLVRKL